MERIYDGNCVYTGKRQQVSVELIKVSFRDEKDSWKRGQISCNVAGNVGCNGAKCSVLKENGIV